MRTAEERGGKEAGVFRSIDDNIELQHHHLCIVGPDRTHTKREEKSQILHSATMLAQRATQQAMRRRMFPSLPLPIEPQMMHGWMGGDMESMLKERREETIEEKIG